MARYSIGSDRSVRSLASSHQAIAAGVVGRGVTAFQDLGPEQIEFELGSETNLRVLWTPGGLVVDLTSAAPLPELPRLMLELDIDSKQVDFRTAERQLKAFGNLYALALILLTDRHELLERALNLGASAEFEGLLSDAEQIYLESIFPGSLIYRIWSTAKDNYRAAIAVAAGLSTRYAEAMVRKLETENRLNEAKAQDAAAHARLTNAEAAEKELDVISKLRELGITTIEREPALAVKLPPGETKDLLYRVARQQITNLLGNDANSELIEAATARLLGPRDSAEDDRD